MTGADVDVDVTVRRGAFTLDVQLRADAGEVVAVMGPSGAGKSTLLAALAGFAELTAGSVQLDGRTVDAASGPHVPPRRRSVALLGQEPRLFPHLLVRENIAFGPRAARVPRHRAREDADAWLERVGLVGFGDRRPAQLSGGQQQRVALARALATSPQLLLLDEPLTSLDPATAAEIRDLLDEQLMQTGTTTLIATHDAVDAVALADRLVVIEAGHVTQTGPVKDVLKTPATTFVAALAADRPRGSDVVDTAFAEDAGRLAAPGHGPVWQARVLDVQELEDGSAAAGDGSGGDDSSGDSVLLHARTPDGALVDIRVPAAARAVPGSMITVTHASPGQGPDAG